MLAGSDSTVDRVLMTFGDRDFHLGMAEVLLGWLLALGAAQVESLLEFEGIFALPDSAPLQAFCASARAKAEEPSRCSIEAVDQPAARYLVRNWRRAPGAAAKRLLL